METLTVYIFSERFDNGAIVYTRLRFYENQPYEVEITTYTTQGSKALDYFIVTATMGNYARLRNLFLKSGTTFSGTLWPDYNGDAFTAHAHFPVEDFITAPMVSPILLPLPTKKILQKPCMQTAPMSIGNTMEVKQPNTGIARATTLGWKAW
ncbi:hypothetical protein KRR40_18430 [Niabella defluvii]|nr:hypothetical protein KRR40_18430 [Niabella sp. I65]